MNRDKASFDEYLDYLFSKGYRMTYFHRDSIDHLKIINKNGDTLEEYEKPMASEEWKLKEMYTHRTYTVSSSSSSSSAAGIYSFNISSR